MNKRETGALYRIETLKLLARLGYASTRQIARGVMGSCDESKRKMIGRTMRWLQDQGMVVAKRDGKGIIKVNYELLYALTAYGVDQLKAHGTDLVGGKLHARDYLRHAHDHRTACNSVYVALRPQQKWSELEVRNGTSPLTHLEFIFDDQEHSKIPDLVAQFTGQGYIWIEVENAWRSDKDLTKMIACMRSMFDLNRGIDRVVFVSTVTGAKTIGKRLRQKLTHGPESGWSAPVRALDAQILKHIEVYELDPTTLTLQRMEF